MLIIGFRQALAGNRINASNVSREAGTWMLITERRASDVIVIEAEKFVRITAPRRIISCIGAFFLPSAFPDL